MPSREVIHILDMPLQSRLASPAQLKVIAAIMSLAQVLEGVREGDWMGGAWKPKEIARLKTWTECLAADIFEAHFGRPSSSVGSGSGEASMVWWMDFCLIDEGRLAAFRQHPMYDRRTDTIGIPGTHTSIIPGPGIMEQERKY